MTDEQRELLQECRRIFRELLVPAHTRQDHAVAFEHVHSIMQRIDAVLERG